MAPRKTKTNNLLAACDEGCCIIIVSGWDMYELISELVDLRFYIKNIRYFVSLFKF